ncbi:MAG: nucleotide exchange factor GrpE [Candidatus Bathyarchaeota archaeon]|nr:nucleotide exchange factor GrpE [Candidatus Bathyarchaeota archaeon]
MPRRKKEKEEAGEGDILKRVADLEAALDEERKKTETYLTQLKYAKADLENTQKRTQRNIEEALVRANGKLLTRLLPILDELELAIEAARDGGGEIVEGVEMVRNKLVKLMEAEGMASIDAVGEPFDPRLHEAVLEVETSDHPAGTVVEEFRRGYTYRDRVLRASVVKVARNPSSDDDQGEVEDE